MVGTAPRATKPGTTEPEGAGLIKALETMVRWNQVPVSYEDIAGGRVSAQRVTCMKEAAEVLRVILQCLVRSEEIPGPLSTVDRRVVTVLACGPDTAEKRMELERTDFALGEALKQVVGHSDAAESFRSLLRCRCLVVIEQMWMHGMDATSKRIVYLR